MHTYGEPHRIIKLTYFKNYLQNRRNLKNLCTISGSIFHEKLEIILTLLLMRSELEKSAFS